MFGIVYTEHNYCLCILFGYMRTRTKIHNERLFYPSFNPCHFLKVFDLLWTEALSLIEPSSSLSHWSSIHGFQVFSLSTLFFHPWLLLSLCHPFYFFGDPLTFGSSSFHDGGGATMACRCKSSSSTVSTGYRRCGCGDELILLKSNSITNPGRKFWRCPNWNVSWLCCFDVHKSSELFWYTTLIRRRSPSLATMRGLGNWPFIVTIVFVWHSRVTFWYFIHIRKPNH